MNQEHGRLTDAVDQLKARWVCVYCGQQVPDEFSPHCGEVGHTEPMPEDE